MMTPAGAPTDVNPFPTLSEGKCGHEAAEQSVPAARQVEPSTASNGTPAGPTTDPLNPAYAGPHPGYGTAYPPAKRAAVCPWCESVHVSDVICVCPSDCGRGWCPAGVEEGPL